MLIQWKLNIWTIYFETTSLSRVLPVVRNVEQNKIEIISVVDISWIQMVAGLQQNGSWELEKIKGKAAFTRQMHRLGDYLADEDRLPNRSTADKRSKKKKI